MNSIAALQAGGEWQARCQQRVGAQDSTAAGTAMNSNLHGPCQPTKLSAQRQAWHHCPLHQITETQHALPSATWGTFLLDSRLEGPVERLMLGPSLVRGWVGKDDEIEAVPGDSLGQLGQVCLGAVQAVRLLAPPGRLAQPGRLVVLLALAEPSHQQHALQQADQLSEAIREDLAGML